MHEYSITCDILKTVLAEAQGKEVKKITLVIGDMSSIIDESVQMYWELLAEGTLAEKAELEFKRVEGKFICNNCSFEFPIKHSNFKCPKCGGESFKITDESKYFYIESIEV